MKRAKRQARRRWGLGKALGLMVLAGVLAIAFSGKLPAVALPEEPTDEDGIFRQPVRVLHRPAEPAGESDEEPDQTAPAETPRMPKLPVEESGEEEAVSVVVPQSDPVGMEYFSDAVFLGDSRTEGLYIYGNITEGDFLYAVGATVESVFISVTKALTLPLVKVSYTSPMSVTVCLLFFSFSAFSAAFNGGVAISSMAIMSGSCRIFLVFITLFGYITHKARQC